MDHQIFRSWPCFILFSVAFSLCWRSGSFGSMNEAHVSAVIDYIRCHVDFHYAVAVRLDPAYCKDPTRNNLRNALPPNVMQEMRAELSRVGGLYNPRNIGNIVAARPTRTLPHEHAEWRLLTGGTQSPVERMLANKDQNSCLFFFSKLSPCVERCLNENDARNIVQTINPIFNRYREDSRAFVFETVYNMDASKEAKVVVDAWKLIQNAPLFRYPFPAVKCFGNNNQPPDSSPCLGP
ncbi:hypothetical protein JRQ81_005491 [Phrynocephalus forsythii]|uniref:Uncharacterized protein n=1 Tax=Phrynocephalus forsythii TaxID=171643 RepID=A0A9Q0XII7_9SAUR|nr:hypothetical protein JRQ81_005491 [Phrynocephalus forsythii]